MSQSTKKINIARDVLLEYTYDDTNFKSNDYKVLINLKEKDVVVVVGSHGKTTFCLNLCEELEKKEKKTAFTTTVKIFQVDKKYRFYNLTFHIELEKEEKFLKENFDSFLLKKIKKVLMEKPL